MPRYWKFVDAFPMTVTGKVQKFRMREMAVAELGLAHRGAADEPPEHRLLTIRLIMHSRARLRARVGRRER